MRFAVFFERSHHRLQLIYSIPAIRALHRAHAETRAEPTARSTEVQQVAGDTRSASQQDDMTESLDSGKRKREAKDTPDIDPSSDPVVNHVFQLGPSGERVALNPWFLQMLGQMKDKLKQSLGELKTQNSWFDWSAEVMPTSDGHAGGFTLPTGVS